jgi:uncharacterized protein (TIGR02246 family)
MDTAPESRLEATVDRLELRELVEAYAFAADARDRRAFAEVFTADGVLRTSGSSYEGRAAIAGVLDHLDAHYPTTMHFVGNHKVTVCGDEADGLTYCLAHHVSAGHDGQRDTLMVIRYTDEYRKTCDGWRISLRSLEIDWQEDRPLTL